MGRSKVYFTDFRTKYMGEPIPKKFIRLVSSSGIKNIDFKDKFVAIKMHFGEAGNLGYLRPNFAKALADYIKELGGKPFLTDCNTMYVGKRKNALEHLECAWENGFGPLSGGAPIIIGDGLKGTDDVAVELKDCPYTKVAYIGRAIMDADIIISLSHFKGHEFTGFGGALKNLGMGCGSRAGKKDMHSKSKPGIRAVTCRGCKLCMKECANNGLVFDEESKKMTVNYDNCVGCGKCLGACNVDAIYFEKSQSIHDLDAKIAEYSKAVCDGKPNFHISLVMDVSPCCDCHKENDAPIISDVGMFASSDPVALDQACVDACLKAEPLKNSLLTDHLEDKTYEAKNDPFLDAMPGCEWETQLSHGEKIGLGNRKYDLITI